MRQSTVAVDTCVKTLLELKNESKQTESVNDLRLRMPFSLDPWSYDHRFIGAGEALILSERVQWFNVDGLSQTKFPVR